MSDKTDKMDPKKEYIFYFLIVGRSGSLLYSKQYDVPGIQRVGSNDLLLLASTFHAIHAISSSVAPQPILQPQTANGNSNIISAPVTNFNTDQMNASVTLGPKSAAPQQQAAQVDTSIFSISTPAAQGNPQATTHNQKALDKLFHPERLPIQPLQGITSIDTKTQKFSCLQTPTGVKFIILSSKKYPNIQALLKQTYVAYCDYVLKNPFSTLGMPIRAELFEKHLTKIIQSIVPTPKS